MADLDDFFAKKDRKKKSKSKKGFSIANTDILAKNLEENDRKEAKADLIAAPLATSEANKAQAAANDSNEPENEAEEWKTLDDEKKDYSNLKIDALKVDSGSEAEEDVEHEMNDEGEMVPVKKGDGGPWNKQPQQGEPGAPGGGGGGGSSNEPSEKERKEAAKAELEANFSAPKGSIVGGSYVPPHLRGGGGSSPGGSSSPSGLPQRPKKRLPLPDINSQVYFPSLSATVSSGPGDHDSAASRGHDFEEVKHGNTQHAPPKDGAGSAVALDNKFSALRD